MECDKLALNLVEPSKYLERVTLYQASSIMCQTHNYVRAYDQTVADDYSAALEMVEQRLEIGKVHGLF
jgi:hypothetical protein